MLSVVIPTYNRAKYLGRALDSLREQDFPPADFEVVIIDDGSNDNTARLVENYDGLDCRYFRQEHSGVSAARNLGIEKSAGEIIVFFDDDARADKDWLANIARIMATENIITGQVKPLANNLWRYFAPHYYQGDEPTTSPVLLEGNCAVRREVFQKIGNFDANLDYGHEGEEFIARASQEYQIMYYPDVVIFHDYAFGLINYLKKQFKFGEKTAYLETKGQTSEKKAAIENRLLNQAGLMTKLAIKIVANFGRLAHGFGRLTGRAKYRHKI